MLIINADDFGQNRLATDRILAGFRHGSVTSTSAMVFMEDSERAAGLANEAGLDTGLHLNFTQRFTGPIRNSRVAEQQGEIAGFLGKNKFAQLIYHPGLRKQFRYVFEVQLEEFQRCFGKCPSHFDGHHHMHLCTNMLFDSIIPAGQKVRRSFTFFPGQKGRINNAYRWFVDKWIRRQHRTTDYLFALPDCIRFNEFDRVVALANQTTVELETHPENPDDLEWLMGDRFQQFLKQVKTGTYTAL